MDIDVLVDTQDEHGHATFTSSRTYSIDTDMQNGHRIDMQHGPGLRAWTWSCSMDFFMQHRPGQQTCMDAGMPIKSSFRHR
jgi:hypothetical protein